MNTYKVKVTFDINADSYDEAEEKAMLAIREASATLIEDIEVVEAW